MSSKGGCCYIMIRLGHIPENLRTPNIHVDPITSQIKKNKKGGRRMIKERGGDKRSGAHWDIHVHKIEPRSDWAHVQRHYRETRGANDLFRLHAAIKRLWGVEATIFTLRMNKNKIKFSSTWESLHYYSNIQLSTMKSFKIASLPPFMTTRDLEGELR